MNHLKASCRHLTEKRWQKVSYQLKFGSRYCYWLPCWIRVDLCNFQITHFVSLFTNHCLSMTQLNSHRICKTLQESEQTPIDCVATLIAQHFFSFLFSYAAPSEIQLFLLLFDWRELNWKKHFCLFYVKFRNLLHKNFLSFAFAIAAATKIVFGLIRSHYVGGRGTSHSMCEPI